jgi:hypothetical protein
VEPLWNLLKTVEVTKRLHRADTFCTGFAQAFAQAIFVVYILFSITYVKGSTFPQALLLLLYHDHVVKIRITSNKAESR